MKNHELEWGSMPQPTSFKMQNTEHFTIILIYVYWTIKYQHECILIIYRRIQ